jgi:L,D-transpeptidase YbiS
MEPGQITLVNRRITRKQRVVYLLIIISAALALSFLFSTIILKNALPLVETTLHLIPRSNDATLLNRVPAAKLDVYRKGLVKNIVVLSKRLDSFIPRQPYLIINTTNNSFRLMKYDQVLREGVCSTGSYTILTSGGKQKWVFETPRGMLKIKGKEQEPVWVKPDWAFVEEGLPVPSPRHESRYDYSSLGDYKLTLGDGYMIHGTLYKRFLGMSVTHGCIRLGDDDLESIFKNLKVGSKVLIY